MDSLRRVQHNWEGLAQADPLWSVCTDPGKRNGRWSQQDFFQTGRTEIERVLAHVQALGVSLDPAARALDFGCGVGRLTSALATHFAECWGIDIAPRMIQLAREFHGGNPRCRFFLNQTDNLRNVADEFFGFIYTSIVFQHIPRKYIRRYVRELVRVLRPGGAFVFQVVERDRTPMLRRLRNRLGIRRMLERRRGRKGTAAFFMETHCIREKEVRRLCAECRVRLVDVRLTNSTDPDFDGDLRFLPAEPRGAAVSKLYCVTKPA
ncbi:MAG TPA: class I SAM-dependent methyltransferase [Terriglobales bacterium]|jgi:SAM-dependent methyltransferase|nr:class I SAM-dependent methyltransferase [Terriglobales bacterium]